MSSPTPRNSSLDAACTIVAGAAIAPAVYLLPKAVPPGLPIAFYLTCLLAARALLVPSAWQRTLWISTLAVLPSIIAIVYGVALPRNAQIVALVLAAWCVMAVLLAAWISSVVSRLRRSVREARQFGQYKVESKIGEDGTGALYSASHAILSRPTVVKLLPTESAGDLDLARFERDVRIASRLSSPNAAAVYGFGRNDDGVFYYAMEHLDGIDLERLVREAGPLPPARAIHVLVQVCNALIDAHEAGLVHRALKPSNVMLCRHGGVFDLVKVLDFGLVNDAVLGTALYVSPEAISEPETVDERSDLYAVGALGYFILTGHPVFEAGTVEEAHTKHLHTDAVPASHYLANVPPDLEVLILSCLQKSQASRPRTARALRKLLFACDHAGRWRDADAHAWWGARDKPDSDRPPAAPAALVATRMM